MDKLIMVLAGSLWQIPLVKKVRSMGFKSLVLNLYEDSPAFAYADYHEVVDILDKEACLEIGKKFNVSAVLSDQSDIVMPTIAYVADNLKLYSLGSQCAALFTNKFLMREFSSLHKFPVPEFKVCRKFEEAEAFFVRLNNAIIIKPLDSNSSRGVFKITSREQLRENFDSSLSFSRVEKAVIAERYIEGVEFTLDGLKVGQKHITLAVSEKKHYLHNENIAYQLFFSHSNETFDYDILRSVNDKFVELSGLPDGCLTHAEYKFQDGHFYLIEIAARGGGNLISSDIVPIMSGVDNYTYLINSGLGIPNTNEIKIKDEFKDRCAVLFFFDAPFKGGIVKEIEGVNIINTLPNIIDFKLNFKVGDKIEKAQNDSNRIGYYIAFADSQDDLKYTMDTISKNFRIKLD